MKFLALSIFLLFLSTAVSTHAVEPLCWCTAPGCTRTGPAQNCGAGPVKYKGVEVCCNEDNLYNSEFALESPVCGSSQEKPIIGCELGTYYKDDGSTVEQTFCIGNEFTRGASDSVFKNVTNTTVTPGGNFNYNGLPYERQGGQDVYVCNSIASCCAHGLSDQDRELGYVRFVCTDIKTPSPREIPPGVGNTTPDKKAGICTQPTGSGESRLFFPHLKNISFLSTLLQTIFNPAPSTVSKNALPAPKQESSSLSNPDAVTTKIQYHQGLDDNTQYVSRDNNSSLKVNAPAPAPLYNFDGSDNPYKTSGFCSIEDTKVNPGDDLLGPKILSRLTYTQKYQYRVAPSLNCFGDSAVVSEDQRKNCCSFKAAGIGASENGVFPNTREKRYVCGTLPGKDFPTKGRAVVYTKTPLIEYIYDALVVGSQSVLKRIFPQGNPKEFKEIPSQANFIASAVGLNQEGAQVNIQTGNGSTQPTIYIPHLGSLYEYFLQGLQKALRPFSGIIPTSTPTGSYENMIIQIAQKYGVPAGFIKAIWTIETNKSTGGNCDCSNGKACGPMQIGQGAYNSVEAGNLDRCKLPDAFEIAAKVLLWKKYCTLQSCPFDKNDPIASGGINPGEYYVVARYNGSDGCYANNETQCRWGQGYSYCDATRAIENNLDLPSPSLSVRKEFCDRIN